MERAHLRATAASEDGPVKRLLVRVGPIVDPAALLWTAPEQIEPNRYFYRAGALRLPDEGVPLLVSHDADSEIGHVDELLERDGSVYARATVTADDPPRWLYEGTRASVAFIAEDEIELQRGALLVLAADVQELTVTCNGALAREPTARVVEVEEIKTPPPKPKPRRAPAAPAKRPRRTREAEEMREYERRVRAAGPDADPETILVNYRDELGYGRPPSRGQLLRRNCGQVLGLR
jgi:hypothetical protein